MVIEVIVRSVDPFGKLGALFKANVTLPNELRFRQSHRPQCITHGGPGALSHTDGLDIGRLNQSDFYSMLGISVMFCSNGPSSDPAGGSATDDHYRSDRLNH